MEKYILVGIDLGTTNSSISYWDFNKKDVKVLTDAMKKTIPSKIFFNNDKIKFGNYIPLESRENKKNLIHSFKRLINSNEETEFTKSLTYDLTLKNDQWKINNKYSLSDIIILFISHLKKIIINKLGNFPIKAVITIPSNYNDRQRLLIKSSYEKNGIEIIRIINEPTAAALAYGLKDTQIKEENILVFDLGGGTLDLSILEIDSIFFGAVANGGDMNLGGNDFTKVIYDYFLKETNFKLTNDQKNQLWFQSEKAKINLRYRKRYPLKIENQELMITLETFRKLIKPLLNKIINSIDKLLKQRNIIIGDISHIIMIGGSSKLLDLQQIIFTHYGMKPMIYPNLENVVSNGACLQAALLEKVYQDYSDIILVDVLPLSLGIKTSDEVFSVIIPRNTQVPSKRTQKYIPSNIDETNIEIEVYEGIRNLAKDNYLVGKFNFDINKSVSDSIIEVTFRVDNNGILEVSIQDMNSKNKKTVIMNQISKIIKNEELDKYLEIAEKNIESDLFLEKKQKLAYQLENMIIIIKDNLLDESIKISEEDKENILNELYLIEEKIEHLNETKLLKLIKKLEDNYTNLLIVSGNEGYTKAEKYDELDDQLEYSKHALIEKIQYYLSIQDQEADIIYQYLVESIQEVKNITFKKDLIKKEKEIDQNITVINKKNKYDQLITLCNFLLEEIQSGDININKKGVSDLLLLIQNIFDIDKKNSFNNEYWDQQIQKINNLCKKILK